MDIVTCMPFKRQENLSPFIFMSVPSMALRLLSASHFISRLGKSSLSATAGVTSRFLVQGRRCHYRPSQTSSWQIIVVWYICIAPCIRQQEPGVRYVAGELLRSTRMKQRGAYFLALLFGSTCAYTAPKNSKERHTYVGTRDGECSAIQCTSDNDCSCVSQVWLHACLY